MFPWGSLIEAVAQYKAEIPELLIDLAEMGLQAHPDEDFAETFAVWLSSDSDYKKEYAKWPVALRKLKYIEELALESIKLKNKSESGRYPSAVANLNSTLEKFYQRNFDSVDGGNCHHHSSTDYCALRF